MKKLKWQTTVTEQNLEDIQEEDYIFLCTDITNFRIVPLYAENLRNLLCSKANTLEVKKMIFQGLRQGAWLKLPGAEFDDGWDDLVDLLEKQRHYKGDKLIEFALPPVPALEERSEREKVTSLIENAGWFALLKGGYIEVESDTGLEEYNLWFNDLVGQEEEIDLPIFIPYQIMLQPDGACFTPDLERVPSDGFSLFISSKLSEAVDKRLKEIEEED